MSTRSVVAFDDGESITGIYVHSDGYPEGRLPVLRDIYTNTFFRDLGQLRTTLLKHRAGWSLLSTDTAFTADWATRLSHGLDVPGVGVAYAEEDFDMTGSGSEVFAEEYAYVFDLADQSLKVFKGDRETEHLPEAEWAPIGPEPQARLLTIVAAELPGTVCLSGRMPVYTEHHIRALMRRLGLEPGAQLRTDDGGYLADLFHAAVETDLLPGAVYFVTDGPAQDSEGGWINLPVDIPGVDVQTMAILAGDFTGNHYNQHKQPVTAAAVREVLECMASRITTAMANLNTWRAPEPVYVLNIRRPDDPSESVHHGPEPRMYTLDLGAAFDGKASDATTALEWTARRVVDLHAWPASLRWRALDEIEYAVRAFPAAMALASTLFPEQVDPAQVEYARFTLAWLEVNSGAGLDSWIIESFASEPSAEPSYGQACLAAATSQGLDPITAALSAAGIEHDVAQTGGFCMVVSVNGPRKHWFGITASEKPGSAGHWLLVRYSSAGYDEGHVLGWAVPTDAVIDLLTRHQRATRTAPVQSTNPGMRTAPARAVAAVSDAVNAAVDQLTEELPRVFADHRNDLGDWCPWSLVSVTDTYDDDLCPAGCRSSWIDDDPESA
ncbi:hypothetical protein KGQ19_26795 [Catenulispora sp. NL8]|uniref:Uncharacterized protein n=1 Tax=Catenulispora pinistramenti TaxID=2705254 RepID=A0ABS5KWX2_9ACTN|nr:hypothetical protein [Catenulispora pinistramenti]MBS2550484.1 hypothetical protein [Catenulispora pinistramenti]